MANAVSATLRYEIALWRSTRKFRKQSAASQWRASLTTDAHTRPSQPRGRLHPVATRQIRPKKVLCADGREERLAAAAGLERAAERAGRGARDQGLQRAAAVHARQQLPAARSCKAQQSTQVQKVQDLPSLVSRVRLLDHAPSHSFANPTRTRSESEAKDDRSAIGC
eukprot:SAG11_NODE_3547_length_2377_cov_3.176471_2_plen_167_part_00